MYSEVHVIETRLQELIMESFVKTDDTLTFRFSKGRVYVENHSFICDFNKFFSLPISLFNLARIRRKYSFKAHRFVSTQINGLNALVFSSLISSENRVLIDDGIGTPALILDKNCLEGNRRFILRWKITNFCLRMLFGIEVLLVEERLKTVTHYFTIYPKLTAILPISFSVTKNPSILSELDYSGNYTLLLGSPMCEFGLMTREGYEGLFRGFQSENVVYVPHPNEYGVNMDLNVCVSYNSAEEYMMNNGFPNRIVSFASSVLLNVLENSMVDVLLFEYIERDSYSTYTKLIESYGSPLTTVKVNKHGRI